MNTMEAHKMAEQVENAASLVMQEMPQYGGPDVRVAFHNAAYIVRELRPYVRAMDALNVLGNTLAGRREA